MTDKTARLFHDRTGRLRQESKKILKNRLRAKVSPHNLVTAAFLLDRCDENDMHSLIDGIENSILKYRALVLCYFCIAAKQLERGDQNGYSEALRQVCMLYDKSPAVTIEIEYHLANILFQEEQRDI